MNTAKYKRFLKRKIERTGKTMIECLKEDGKNKNQIKNIFYSFNKKRNKGSLNKINRKIKEAKENDVKRINSILNQNKG